MLRPRIFISHSSKEPAGEKFRDELAERLRAADYRVLLDKDELELSQDWRSTLNAWIGGCDAAVLLVTQAALKSSYVAYETSLLAYRHEQEKGRFQLIPVYLPPVSQEQLEDTPLAPARVADVQAIRADVPQAQAIQSILDYLDTHVPSEFVAERHARRLCGLIKHVDTVELEKAAERIDAALKPWTPGLELPMKVALCLMASGLDTATKGVRVFRLRVKDALDEVMTLIATSWVDCRSTATIGKVKNQPGLLAINGDNPRTAGLYVVAACDYPVGDSWRVAQVDGVVGGEGIEELKQLVRSALARRLGCAPTEVGETVRDLIETEADPLFVTLPLSGMNQASLTDLRAEFPEITFFFLAGSELPPDELARQAGLEILQPLLEPGIEQPFWLLYDKKLKVLKTF